MVFRPCFPPSLGATAAAWSPLPSRRWGSFSTTGPRDWSDCCSAAFPARRSSTPRPTPAAAACRAPPRWRPQPRPASDVTARRPGRQRRSPGGGGRGGASGGLNGAGTIHPEAGPCGETARGLVGRRVGPPLRPIGRGPRNLSTDWRSGRARRPAIGRAVRPARRPRRKVGGALLREAAGEEEGAEQARRRALERTRR